MNALLAHLSAQDTFVAQCLNVQHLPAVPPYWWRMRVPSAHGATHANGRSGPCPRKDFPMPGHDVIVIGGSAGSLEPLTTLVEGLPPDLPAAVCVTRHASPHARNMVPLILSKAGTLPATKRLTASPSGRAISMWRPQITISSSSRVPCG